MADIHCLICGKPKVHIEDYKDKEKQKSLESSIKMLESIAICNECRGED